MSTHSPTPQLSLNARRLGIRLRQKKNVAIFYNTRPRGHHARQSHNKRNNNNTGRNHQSSLAKSIGRRQTHLASQLASEGKANEFIDWRIGEATRNRNYDGPSEEDVMLKRIVQERVRRSRKREKFNLEDEAGDGDGDDGGVGLTHWVSEGRR